jgi:hypothetical protein
LEDQKKRIVATAAKQIQLGLFDQEEMRQLESDRPLLDQTVGGP